MRVRRVVHYVEQNGIINENIQSVLFVSDVIYHRMYGRQLTGQPYTKYHSGPYSEKIQTCIETEETKNSISIREREKEVLKLTTCELKSMSRKEMKSYIFSIDHIKNSKKYSRVYPEKTTLPCEKFPVLNWFNL